VATALPAAYLTSLAGCATGGRKGGSYRDVFLKSLIADWETGIPQWLQEVKLPGASVVLIHEGKLVWRRGFGVKDTGTNEPVDNETIFAACSNTKPVFAYAVAKLCENGVMDLDTPLTRYTPERIISDPRLDLITARHVLTHTTGFPNWRQEPEPLALQFTPGEKYQYSGEGFSYLQSVVARLTGRSFEDFMRKNILVPFGMNSSFISWDMSTVRQIAKPHDSSGKRIAGKFYTLPNAAEKARELGRYGAAAALMTMPTDYAKFILELMNPKRADRFRLSEAGLREYLRPQFKRDNGQWEALGWVVYQSERYSPVYIHAGQAAGYYCFTNFSTSRKSGVKVMMNGDNWAGFIAKMLPDPMKFGEGMFS